MSNTQLYYGLAIPGIGHKDWGTTVQGANWSLYMPLVLFDGNPTGISGTENGVQFPLLNPNEPPDHLGGSINYRSGTVEVGSLSFSIISDGPQRPYLPGEEPTEKFDIGKFFATRRTDAAGLLAEALSSGDAGIVLWSRDGATFATGDVIHIEKEAIVLYTDTSDGTDTTNSTQSFLCYRGCFGTDAVAHETVTAAPNPPGVYSGYSNRVWFEREARNAECYVVAWDGVSLEVVWRGYFTQQPETDEHGLILTVEPQDAFALLTDRSQNEEPYGTVEKGLDVRVSGNLIHFEGGGQLNAKSHDWGSIRSQGQAPPDPEVPVVLNIGGALYPAYWSTGSNKYVPAKGLGGVQEYDWLIGTVANAYPLETEFNETTMQSATEVLVVGAGATCQSYETDYATEVKKNISYTSRSKTPVAGIHHPLYILLCYMLSTGRHEFQHADYDIWNVGVGLALPIDRVDVAGIEALMAKRPQEELYFSALGFNGSSYSFRDVINKWLLPFRYYVHVTDDYQLTVSRLEVVRPAFATVVSASNITFMTDTQDMGWDETVRTLTATASYPWEEERTIEIRDLSQGILEYDPRPIDPELSYDVSSIRPSSAINGGRQRVALDSLLQFYRRPIPNYRFSITEPGIRFYPGMKMQLDIDEDDSLFYGSDGERLVNGDSILGIVTEIRNDFETNDVEIELSGVNDALVAAPKSIAPSFKVYSASTTLIKFEFDEFGPEEQEAWMQYLIDGGFPYISFWNPSTGIIDAHPGNPVVTVTGVTLSGDKIHVTVATALTTVPVLGDIARLITWDYSGGKDQNVVFTYTADATETFSDGTPGDIFV